TRESEIRSLVTECLRVRLLDPAVQAKVQAHHQRWAEDVVEAGIEAPAIVRSNYAGTARIVRAVILGGVSLGLIFLRPANVQPGSVGEIVIHADRVFVRMERRSCALDVVESRRSGIRVRPEWQHVLRHAVEHCGWNYVSRERIADEPSPSGHQARDGIDLASSDSASREWVVDGARKDRTTEGVNLTGCRSKLGCEVSSLLIRGGNPTGRSSRSAGALTFVVSEEEGLVLPDRAACSDAILMAMEVGFRLASGEVVLRIQGAVAIELERIAVEGVAARLRNYVHDVAAAPPVLRGERVGLNLEFLHSVYGGHIHDAAPVRSCVPGSVEKHCACAEERSAKVQEGHILVGNTR